MPATRLLRLLPALALVFSLGACTAEVEDEGSLPEVNVEGGDMPNIDVDPANVDITTDTQTIVTPDIDITADTTGI